MPVEPPVQPTVPPAEQPPAPLPGQPASPPPELDPPAPDIDVPAPQPATPTVPAPGQPIARQGERMNDNDREDPRSDRTRIGEPRADAVKPGETGNGYAPPEPLALSGRTGDVRHQDLDQQ